jgi:hypothetical protein
MQLPHLGDRIVMGERRAVKDSRCPSLPRKLPSGLQWLACTRPVVPIFCHYYLR